MSGLFRCGITYPYFFGAIDVYGASVSSVLVGCSVRVATGPLFSTTIFLRKGLVFWSAFPPPHIPYSYGGVLGKGGYHTSHSRGSDESEEPMHNKKSNVSENPIM